MRRKLLISREDVAPVGLAYTPKSSHKVMPVDGKSSNYKRKELKQEAANVRYQDNSVGPGDHEIKVTGVRRSKVSGGWEEGWVLLDGDSISFFWEGNMEPRFSHPYSSIIRWRSEDGKFGYDLSTRRSKEVEYQYDTEGEKCAMSAARFLYEFERRYLGFCKRKNPNPARVSQVVKKDPDATKEGQKKEEQQEQRKSSSSDEATTSSEEENEGEEDVPILEGERFSIKLLAADGLKYRSMLVLHTDHLIVLDVSHRRIRQFTWDDISHIECDKRKVTFRYATAIMGKDNPDLGGFKITLFSKSPSSVMIAMSTFQEAVKDNTAPRYRKCPKNYP